MNGAGLMLLSDDGPRGPVCSSDTVSALIEELQFSLAEGPCIDAAKAGRPVMEPDLADPTTPRWPAFARPAVDAGVRAIFGFPLQVGTVRVGALDLYRDQPGPLTDEQYADALVMADVATEALLVLQAAALPGHVSIALEANAEFHFVVHQATGMIVAQLGVSVGHALARLRAYAFSHGLLLPEVARAVVARQVRFDND